MNINQLDRNLSSLTGKKDEIMKIASFCNNQPESAGLIVFMIESEFLKVSIDRKKHYLYLLHQIILQEHQLQRKSIDFIKAIGFKLRILFQDFINTNSIEELDQVYIIVRRWEKEGIYHPHFLLKLRLILQPRYDELLLQQKELRDKQHEIETQNKKMHHDIKRIQSLPASNQTYSQLIQQSNLDQKMVQFTEKKLQSNKMKDLNSLVEEGELCKSAVTNSICQLQSLYCHISLQGEQLVKSLYFESRVEFYKKMRKKLYQ